MRAMPRVERLSTRLKTVKFIPWWALEGGKPPSGSPPPAWDPSQIVSATLLHYLEGDSVVTSSGLVGMATDKSGAGKDYSASGTARPTLLASDLGGKPVMQFNGSSNFLSRSSTQYIPNIGGAITRIILFKPDDLPLTTDYRLLSTFNTNFSGGNQGWFDYLSGHAPLTQFPYSFGYSGGFNPGVNDTLTTTYQLWITVFNGGTQTDLANYKVFKNGVSQTLGSTSAGTGNSTVNEIGRYPGGAFWFNGKIAMDIMASGALSDAEAALTWQYAQNHYGMT